MAVKQKRSGKVAPFLLNAGGDVGNVLSLMTGSLQKPLDNRRKMWYIKLNVVKKSADFANLPEREWCRRLRAPEQMKNAFRFGAEPGKGSAFVLSCSRLRYATVKGL